MTRSRVTSHSSSDWLQVELLELGSGLDPAVSSSWCGLSLPPAPHSLDGGTLDWVSSVDWAVGRTGSAGYSSPDPSRLGEWVLVCGGADNTYTIRQHQVTSVESVRLSRILYLILDVDAPCWQSCLLVVGCGERGVAARPRPLPAPLPRRHPPPARQALDARRQGRVPDPAGERQITCVTAFYSLLQDNEVLLYPGQEGPLVWSSWQWSHASMTKAILINISVR